MNIIKEIFNKIDVLYDDKKWGKRIDPNEWNANFKVLEEGHNNLVDKLLSQFSNIDTVIESATENGGTNVKVNYRGGNETLQDTVDNIISDVDNRYTKNETDVNIATSVNPLFSDISYESSTGKFTFTKKDGSSIVIDTVIEKIPASMALKEESNGSVWLVVTNQDGSTTKTNVTSLIEDTIVTGSDTVNVSSTSDAINKVTTYVLSIKPNSIGLSHVDSELVSKFEETESAKTLAVQAKDNAVSAANSAASSASFAETYANSANSSELNSKKSEINAKAYADSAYEYSNKSLQYKNESEAAKIAAERARNEAESIVGGNYASIEYVDNKVSGLATEEYVQQNGGKIDSISVNGTTQNIDENKNVNIDLTLYAKSENLNSHISDSGIHVTAEERTKWNTKEVFIVTVTYGEDSSGIPQYTSDKTFNEIQSAVTSGKYVFCSYSGNNSLVPYLHINQADIGSTKYLVFFYASSDLYCKITISDQDTVNVDSTFNNYFLPESGITKSGKILMVNSFGEPEWTAITNAEGVAY